MLIVFIPRALRGAFIELFKCRRQLLCVMFHALPTFVIYSCCVLTPDSLATMSTVYPAIQVLAHNLCSPRKDICRHGLSASALLLIISSSKNSFMIKSYLQRRRGPKAIIKCIPSCCLMSAPPCRQTLLCCLLSCNTCI
jgi:hypothetical protein